VNVAEASFSVGRSLDLIARVLPIELDGSAAAARVNPRSAVD
jgi:hypothetical protein